jgi:hypothetical protein
MIRWEAPTADHVAAAQQLVGTYLEQGGQQLLALLQSGQSGAAGGSGGGAAGGSGGGAAGAGDDHTQWKSAVQVGLRPLAQPGPWLL